MNLEQRASTPVRFFVITKNGDNYTAECGDPVDPSFKPNGVTFYYGSNACLVFDGDLYCLVNSWLADYMNMNSTARKLFDYEIRVVYGHDHFIYRKVKFDSDFHKAAVAEARWLMGVV